VTGNKNSWDFNDKAKRNKQFAKELKNGLETLYAKRQSLCNEMARCLQSVHTKSST
jgi:hypothetical protein